MRINKINFNLTTEFYFGALIFEFKTVLIYFLIIKVNIFGSRQIKPSVIN